MHSFVVIIILHIALLAIAAWMIIREKNSRVRRKVMRTIFAVLIPILGPLVTMLILNTDRSSPIKTKEHGPSLDRQADNSDALLVQGALDDFKDDTP